MSDSGASSAKPLQAPLVSLVAAMSANRVIGRAGKLPWHLPEDLKRFKALTTGHSVIMGRKTFESIGRPLPNRTNIVITRQRDFAAPADVLVAHDLQHAIALANNEPEVFIIGGAEIYALAMPRARRIHLTLVHAAIEGDAFFPPLDMERDWKLTRSERREADERHAFAFSFQQYDRR